MKINNLLQSLREKFYNRNVYFFWSGGDDSNLLLRIALDAGLNEICNFCVITIPFPQHVYSEDKINLCKMFFLERNINIKFLSTKDRIDDKIPYNKACSICKTVRRSRFMEYYLPIKKNGDLIVTGHNLSDLLSYYTELCIMELKNNKDNSDNIRFLEVANKFLISYHSENGIEIFRPMLNFTQDEITQLLAETASSRFSFDIMAQKCFWINQRKRLLQDYFIKADIISDYEIVHNLIKNNFEMPCIEDFRTLPFDTYLV